VLDVAMTHDYFGTYDMSCSMDDSTSLPLSDFRKDGRPGVMATVGPGILFMLCPCSSLCSVLALRFDMCEVYCVLKCAVTGRCAKNFGVLGKSHTRYWITGEVENQVVLGSSMFSRM
jgi:hypothetical protein